MNLTCNATDNDILKTVGRVKRDNIKQQSNGIKIVNEHLVSIASMAMWQSTNQI